MHESMPLPNKPHRIPFNPAEIPSDPSICVTLLFKYGPGVWAPLVRCHPPCPGRPSGGLTTTNGSQGLERSYGCVLPLLQRALALSVRQAFKPAPSSLGIGSKLDSYGAGVQTWRKLITLIGLDGNPIGNHDATANSANCDESHCCHCYRRER